MQGEEISFNGHHLKVQGAKLQFPAVQKPYPTLYFNTYADLGIDTFLFSGYPHLEEAYRVAELLFPKLPLQTSTLGTPAAGITLPQQVASTFSEFVTKTDLLKPQPV